MSHRFLETCEALKDGIFCHCPSLVRLTRVHHACVDSGFDKNIISLDTVRQMQLEVQPGHNKQFVLAKGKLVQIAGFVKLDCGFGVGTPLPSTTLACISYVFITLAVPMIVRIGCLAQTKTLTKQTDRLIDRTVSDMQALKVNSIGSKKRSVLCRLNTFNGCRYELGLKLDTSNGYSTG